MKNIKYLFVLLAGLLFVACSGDPELRFQSYEEGEKGAFARNLGYSGTFLLQDVPGSAINGEVEFYSELKGADVATYTWTVEFRANGGGNGGVNIPAVAFKTFTSAEFVPSNSVPSLPSLKYTLGMQEALDALGLDVSDITGGDQFRMDATVTLTDGRSWGQENTGGNLISQPPFLALVRINSNVVCSSDIGGTYSYVSAGTSTDGCCPGPYNLTGSVTMTDLGGGEYTISDWSAGMYVEWYSVYGIAISDVSETVADICETFYGSFSDPFGGSMKLNGTIDPTAGVIVYSLDSSWGDTIDATLTKQ
jgi:hypothetical protein